MSVPRTLVTERPRPLRLFARVGTFVLACWLPVEARAADSFPPACGSRAELERELRTRISAEISLEELDVRIEPRPPNYLLRVRSKGEERWLEDADCRELFRAAVVISVAMLDPAHEAPAKAEPPTPPPAPPAEAPQAVAKVPPPARPALVPAASTRPSEPAAPGLRLDPRLTVGLGINTGLLPSPGLVLDVEGALFHERFGVALGVRYLPPTSDRNADGRGVQVSALGAELLGLCRVHPAVELRLGVVGHRLFGTGQGSVEQQSGSAWAFGPLAGLSVAFLRRAPYLVALGGEASRELVRARFQILDYGEVFRVSPWNASFFLRAGLFFE